MNDLNLDFNNVRRTLYQDSSPSFLIQEAIKKGHGNLSQSGALRIITGKQTGRSAKDRYVVSTIDTQKNIWWSSEIKKMSPENFLKLKRKTLAYLNEDHDLYLTERSVGAHDIYNMGVRMISTHPSHVLFSQYLFRKSLRKFLVEEDFTILHAPKLVIDPDEYHVRSRVVIATCFDTKTTLIIGTLYAGEIKKSMFCVMNYLLPPKGVLPMHSGCNKLPNDEVSLFFGLSGTGKTTLSTVEGTRFIGDDEHGLFHDGVFNFEGGCYAKTFRLSKETEPTIFQASFQFGSLLENVVLSEKSGKLDFFDNSLSENGRSSYPLSFIKDHEESSRGNIPKHIFFLCADAFGVLPPVSKLTHEQAMYYFILGYTAKIAGTEIGVKEPHAVFSSCFGAPFMLRHPSEYAALLKKYIEKYPIDIWFINTGWTGGPYGIGQRFPLHMTRKIIHAIQHDQLTETLFEKDPIFDLNIPTEIKQVPTSLLFPKSAWAREEDYTIKAKELVASFKEEMKNFDLS